MKKQLLNESDIRKMMKFANIGALSDGFVERLTEASMADADEEMAEGMQEDEMEETLYEQEDEEVDAAVPPEMDMGDEEELEGEGEGDVLGHVSDAVEALKAALEAAGPAGAEAAAAITVQEEGGEEELDEPEMDMGGEEEMDMGDEEEMPADLAMEPEEGEGEEEALAEMVDEEEVMNEVARRVAKRLLRMKKQ